MHEIPENYKKYSYLNFSFMVAYTLVASILSIYLKGIGYTDIQLGIVFSVFPLTIIFFIPIIGNLADIVGKKKIIVLALFAEVIAFSLYIFDTNTLLIILARLLDAIAAATLVAILIAKTEDTIKDHRGAKSGFYFSLLSLGQLIAPPVAILLADRYFIKLPFIVAIVIVIGLIFTMYDKKEFHFKKLHRKDFSFLQSIKTFSFYFLTCI